MTYNMFSGTLNPTHFTSLRKCLVNLFSSRVLRQHVTDQLVLNAQLSAGLVCRIFNALWRYAQCFLSVRLLHADIVTTLHYKQCHVIIQGFYFSDTRYGTSSLGN